MKYSQVLAHVQKIGHFGSAEDAEKAVLAVSFALAVRVGREIAKKMASQMPKEIASAMSSASGHETFGLQEFFNRVAEKMSATSSGRVSPAEAMHHAEAALAVLQDAMPTEVLEAVFSGLDAEYRKFLDASAVLGKREGLSLQKAAFRL